MNEMNTGQGLLRRCPTAQTPTPTALTELVNEVPGSALSGTLLRCFLPDMFIIT